MPTPPDINQRGQNWDLLGGTVVMLIGAGFLYFGSNLRLGTLAGMGPGFLPIVVSVITILLGAFTAARSLWSERPAVAWPSFRALLIVVACPLLFALLIRRLGLVLTILIVASVARLAEKQHIGIEAVLMPVILAAFCVLVFGYLLNLNIPLWP